MSNHYIVGKILKPHGVKGEIRAEIITDFPERFTHLQSIYLSPPDGGDCFSLKIISVRFHKELVLLKLAGVEDRDAAEELRGCELLIPESERWEKGEGYYYFHELLGLPAVLPGGDPVGKVSGFERGSQLILKIETPAGGEILVPFVREFVEVESGSRIILHPIPGLLATQGESDKN